jgi:cell wall-associated NlpC family hydrolase
MGARFSSAAGELSRAQLYSARTLPYITSMKSKLFILVSLLFVACSTAPGRQFAASNDQVNELVMYAISLSDTPYRYGGKSASTGFDCSGFVDHVYRHVLGISLPRTSRKISGVGKPVSLDELSPGDLVFFNTQHASFSHVGIYIGDGEFVHSPRTGESVRTERMDLRYWRTRYDGARHLFN